MQSGQVGYPLGVDSTGNAQLEVPRGAFLPARQVGPQMQLQKQYLLLTAVEACTVEEGDIVVPEPYE